LLAILRLRVNK